MNEKHPEPAPEEVAPWTARQAARMAAVASYSDSHHVSWEEAERQLGAA